MVQLQPTVQCEPHVVTVPAKRMPIIRPHRKVVMTASVREIVRTEPKKPIKRSRCNEPQPLENINTSLDKSLMLLPFFSGGRKANQLKRGRQPNQHANPSETFPLLQESFVLDDPRQPLLCVNPPEIQPEPQPQPPQQPQQTQQPQQDQKQQQQLQEQQESVEMRVNRDEQEVLVLGVASVGRRPRQYDRCGQGGEVAGGRVPNARLSERAAAELDRTIAELERVRQLAISRKMRKPTSGQTTRHARPASDARHMRPVSNMITIIQT